MPRNVRPSWVDVAIDNSSNNPQVVKGTGPKGRSGTLSALFKVRSAGSVLDLLDVTMIGSEDGRFVNVTVTDKRTGKWLFSENVTQ